MLHNGIEQTSSHIYQVSGMKHQWYSKTPVWLRKKQNYSPPPYIPLSVGMLFEFSSLQFFLFQWNKSWIQYPPNEAITGLNIENLI